MMRLISCLILPHHQSGQKDPLAQGQVKMERCAGSSSASLDPPSPRKCIIYISSSEEMVTMMLLCCRVTSVGLHLSHLLQLPWREGGRFRKWSSLWLSASCTSHFCLEHSLTLGGTAGWRRIPGSLTWAPFLGSSCLKILQYNQEAQTNPYGWSQHS